LLYFFNNSLVDFPVLCDILLDGAIELNITQDSDFLLWMLEQFLLESVSHISEALDGWWFSQAQR